MEYIYDSEQQLLIFGSNEGDIAFVKSTNTLYTFVDLSSAVSFSYDFNGVSSLIRNNKLYDSALTYTIDFWSFSTTVNDKPHFTIYDGEGTSTLNEVSNNFPITGTQTIDIVPFSPSDSISGSMYFDGSAILSLDASRTQPQNNNIEFNHEYTVSFWVYDKTPTNGKSSILTYDNFGKTIVSIKNDKVVANGMSFPLNTTLNKNVWASRKLHYDGIDYYYGEDSDQYFGNKLLPQYSITIGQGEKTFDYITTKDAAFQFSTKIPVNVPDGILFSLGQGSNITKLETLSGNLKLTAKNLVAQIPFDSANISSLTPTRDIISVDSSGNVTYTDYYMPVIISWDYRISEQLEAIRLGIRSTSRYIDSNNESILAPQLEDVATNIFGTNFNAAWASTVVSNDTNAFSEITLTQTDIEELPYYSYQFIDQGITKSTVNFAFMDGKNIRVYPHYNPSKHYFRINGSNATYFNQSGNKVYYFEIFAETALSNYEIYPFFVSNDAPISIGTGASTDLYDRSKTDGDKPEDFTSTVTQFVNPGGSYYNITPPLNQSVIKFYPRDTNNKIISCIIDETNNMFYTLYNGNYHNSRSWAASLLVTDNPFSLGFQVVSDYYGFTPNSGSMKIILDRTQWNFDPYDMYEKSLTATSQTNPAIVGASTTGFLNSNVAPTWALRQYVGAPFAPSSNLKYYPQAFPSDITANDSSGMLSIGISKGSIVNRSNMTGAHYAAAYVASTGGNIHNSFGVVDLQTIIASANDGDAILLSPGVHNCSSAILNNIKINSSTNTHSIFGKNVLICGSTNDPNDVIINYTISDTGSIATPIFTGNKLCQLAFLTFNKNVVNTNTNPVYYPIFMKDFGGKAQSVIFNFNNQRVSLLYDTTYYPVNDRTLVDCIFKNYSIFESLNVGRLDLLNVSNCKFEKNCPDIGLVKEIGNNDFYCSFDSNSNYIQYPFTGYIADLQLKLANLYYSGLQDPIIEDKKKRIADSNTIALIETQRSGDNILRLDADGTLYVSDRMYLTEADSANTWLHHRISFDGSEIRHYKNGLLKQIIADSSNLDSTSLYIGKGFEFDPSINSLVDVFNQEIIKDFVITNTSFNDSSYIPPLYEKSALTPQDIIWTANNNDPDINEFTEQGNISLVQFSPYSLAGKKWAKYMQVNIGFDSVFMSNINGQNIIETVYDSTYDNPLNVYLKLIDIDDNGDSIRWTSDTFSVDNAVLVKQKGNNEFMVVKSNIVDSTAYATSSSMITFTPHNIHSLDDSISQFYIAPQNDDVIHTLPLISHYGKYGMSFKITSSIIHLKYISDMYQIDSTFDSTGYL